MPRKKLTAALKAKIKSEYRKLNPSEFTGDALTYLNRVRGAAKARQSKTDKYIQIGEQFFPKDSDIGKIVVASAKIAKVSPSRYAKKHKEELAEFVSSYRETVTKDIDYVKGLFKEMPSNGRVYVNGEKVSRVSAKFKLTEFARFIRGNDTKKNKVMAILVNASVDTKGNVYLKIPDADELEELDFETVEDLIDYLEYEYEIDVIVSDKAKKK